MDWARFRTVGFDLILVGVLVFAFSLSLGVYTLCPPSESCPVQVDWPTLSPGMALLAVGIFLTYMARKQKKEAS